MAVPPPVTAAVARLQALPQDILAQEKTITALTGQNVDQKWFVVYGASAQETLERLEAFAPALAQAQKAGELTRWRTLPRPNPLELGRPAAAKIGRAPDGRAAWTAGYTGIRVGVTWIGLAADAAGG